MSDTADFQSEKLCRSVEANNKIMKNMADALIQSNNDMGEVCVYLSKQLEKIEIQAPQPYSKQAGAAVVVARQMVKQALERYKKNTEQVAS